MSFVRILALASVAALAVHAQHRLHAVGAATKNWVVGFPLQSSGLFVKSDSGKWENPGHRHPQIHGIVSDGNEAGVLYLAAGNGCIRVDSRKPGWRILTGSDVTELQDISIGADGSIVFAHTTGIRVSTDHGATWREVAAPLPRRYVSAIVADRLKAGRIVAGTDIGLYATFDSGRTWTLSGAAGFQIMRIAQSPHDPQLVLAVTQQGGLFRSDDGGNRFESSGRVGVGDNLYDIAFDSTDPKRIALCGWGPGVVVSEDGGKTWQSRNAGLPSHEIWSIAFDPDHPGRLYASAHEDALYVSDDAGRTWRQDGLPGSIVYRMAFLPIGGAR